MTRGNQIGKNRLKGLSRALPGFKSNVKTANHSKIDTMSKINPKSDNLFEMKVVIKRRVLRHILSSKEMTTIGCLYSNSDTFFTFPLNE